MVQQSSHNLRHGAASSLRIVMLNFTVIIFGRVFFSPLDYIGLNNQSHTPNKSKKISEGECFMHVNMVCIHAISLYL